MTSARHLAEYSAGAHTCAADVGFRRDYFGTADGLVGSAARFLTTRHDETGKAIAELNVGRDIFVVVKSARPGPLVTKPVLYSIITRIKAFRQPVFQESIHCPVGERSNISDSPRAADFLDVGRISG